MIGLYHHLPGPRSAPIDLTGQGLFAQMRPEVMSRYMTDLTAQGLFAQMRSEVMSWYMTGASVIGLEVRMVNELIESGSPEVIHRIPPNEYRL